MTTQAELEKALNCRCNNLANCTQILIPVGTTLVMTSHVTIGSSHTGLLLTIAGVVEWQGGPGPTNKIFRIADATDITIEGIQSANGGLITSNLNPANHDGNPGSETIGIAKAFEVPDQCTNLTIKNLRVSKLTSLLEVATGQVVNNLDVTNVHGTDLIDYGFFISDKFDGDFVNCSINGTIRQHPFRLYATSVGLDVINCWSYNSGKTGLWIAEGMDATVDRFSSSQELRIGPDSGWCGPSGAQYPCASDPLSNVHAQSLRTSTYVQLEMELRDACIVNTCAPGTGGVNEFNVGRSASSVAHTMTMFDVNWDAIHDESNYVSASVATNSNILSNVQSVAYSYCFADINRDDVVNVTDLLAIISAWGACPAPPSGVTGPYPPCAADIAPHTCGDNAVNVSDLLDVISLWGDCPGGDACGAQLSRLGGFSEGAPETLDDCYDDCIASYPTGGAEFAACYDACVQSLCRRGLIECD